MWSTGKNSPFSVNVSKMIFFEVNLSTCNTVAYICFRRVHMKVVRKQNIFRRVFYLTRKKDENLKIPGIYLILGDFTSAKYYIPTSCCLIQCFLFRRAHTIFSRYTLLVGVSTVYLLRCSWYLTQLRKL